jgi:integrase
VLQIAGLPDEYSLHSLRHTYATHLREKGVPRDIIQSLLGHSSPDTTTIYDHSDALYFRQFADMVDFEEVEGSD